MNFLHFDLGRLQGGLFVEVSLQGNAANVRLLDNENFHHYRTGDSYYYTGGCIHITPAYLLVPRTAHWHLALDMEGLEGSATSTVRVLRELPPTVPALMNRLMYNDCGQISEARLSAMPLKNKYDAFIASVPEDKGELARPLAQAFAKRGVRAGFEEFEIKNDPAEVLRKGLDNCRCGVFIITRNLLSKRWSEYEWDSVAAKVTGGSKPVFVIWDGVTANDIKPCSERLSKKPARQTVFSSMEVIAGELAAIINSAD